MSNTFYRWPATSSGGVTAYANAAALPLTAVDGTLAVTIDTDSLYIYDAGTASWKWIAAPDPMEGIGTIDTKTPSADGGVYDTGFLFFQSASATAPGLVNLTTQSFAGNKTFTGTIGASNLSGTNTGNVTIGTASGLSIVGQALSLGLASAGVTGALSGTDWSTFNNKQPAGTYVTSLTVTTGNGVSGSFTAGATPALSLTLGAITPTTVNGNTLTTGTGTLTLSTFTLTVTATASIGGTHSGTSSGTNTGDQTITLTGNVTGSGTGSFATTIAAGVVTNAMLAGSIDLTAKVTGVLPVLNGGTGVTTSTGSGANALATSPSFTTSILPAVNYAIGVGGDVGSSSFLWKDLYFGRTLIHTGVQPTSVASTPATAASDILTITPAVGGNTTIATTGVGGVGAGLNVTMGTGGTAASAVTASTGGAGGVAIWQGGVGGAATASGSGTNIGGGGGQGQIKGGVGGAASGGAVNTGGAGGNGVINPGNGGAVTGAGTTNTGGAAGALVLNNGNGIGGAASGATTNIGGAGTNFVINNSGGTGGAATGAGTTNTGGAGSNVSINSGAGGAASGATTNNGGAGGTVTLTAGVGGVGTQTTGANGVINLATGGSTRVTVDGTGNLQAKYGFATSGYQVLSSGTAPVNAGSVTMNNNSPGVVLIPAGTIATYTITFPSSPIDGQIIFITTTQVVTAVTLNGTGINGAPAGLSPSVPVSFIWLTSVGGWLRC